MAIITSPVARASTRRRRLSPETAWGIAFLIPYVVVFVTLVIYPVGYGLWLGAAPASYARLFNDPVYLNTLVNTALFLLLGVNVKMVLALLLSGFFVHSARWVRWVSFIFILPWAIPSIPTILSFRWMLNAEWGMINNILFKYFQIEGPNWLLEPNLALGAIIVVHIWKYLPFWTLIMVSGRLTISKDLYEAAEVDGANAFQKFIHITFPSVQNLYITSTLLSTIWSLGDFNSIYLLTGGGPADATQVLATLGIRYAFGMSEISTGMATVITALPLMIPLTFVMLRRLRREAAR